MDITKKIKIRFTKKKNELKNIELKSNKGLANKYRYGDWYCIKCGFHAFARNYYCPICGTIKHVMYQ